MTAADHLLAHQLATKAGELLLSVRSEMVAAGAGAAELKTAGDRRANGFLMEQLGRSRPNDPILSEEEQEDPEVVERRLRSRRAWIVDPLDGTREFSEPPRSDWAVHVALSVDGVPVVGAVALPALGITLSTHDVLSTHAPISAPPEPPGLPPTSPRVIVSRSRPPAVALAISDAVNGVLVEMGSAGAKAMAVVRGEADIYPHAGGQYEWDSCAPVAVAMAYGLWCSRIDGSPLRYNNRDPYLPDLLICRPEMAAEAIRAAD